MKQLFINSFITKDHATLFGKLELIIIMWLIVFVAIAIDLIAGLRKATLLGELHTSYGFRRTVSKAVQYYGLLCFAFLFDVLSSLVSPIPYFTMLSACFLVFIEAKSVFEKAHEKDRRKLNKNLKDIITLVENKDDLLKGISEILNNQENSPKEQSHDK